MLPSWETSSGWRNELTGKFLRENADFCSWAGATPCTSIYAGNHPAGKQFCKKGPGHHDGHQAEHELVPYLCSKEGYGYHGML